MDRSQITLLIAGIVVIDLIVLMIWLAARRRKQEQNERLEAAGMQRGWDPLPTDGPRTAYRFRGRTDGFAWVVEGMRSSGSGRGSSSSPATTTLYSGDIRLDEGAVFLGPQPLGKQMLMSNADLSNPLVRLALRAVFGRETADLIGRSEILSAGGSALREHYLVVGTDESAAEQVLTIEVEQDLVDWRLRARSKERLPVMSLDENGLRLRLINRLATIDELEHLIQLGAEIGRALHGSEWS